MASITTQIPSRSSDRQYYPPQPPSSSSSSHKKNIIKSPCDTTTTTKPPSSRGRKGSKQGNNNYPKKPQRGMGVAQLEKLRFQEQMKQEAAATAANNNNNTTTDVNFLHLQHQHQQQQIIHQQSVTSTPVCKFQQQQHQHQQQQQFDVSTYPFLVFNHHNNVDFHPRSTTTSCLGIGKGGDCTTIIRTGVEHPPQPSFLGFNHSQQQQQQQQPSGVYHSNFDNNNVMNNNQHFTPATTSSPMQMQMMSGVYHHHHHPTTNTSASGLNRTRSIHGHIAGGVNTGGGGVTVVKEEEGVRRLELPSIPNLNAYGHELVFDQQHNAAAAFSFKKKRVNWGENCCYDRSEMGRYEGVEVVAVHRKSGGSLRDQVVMEYGFFPTPPPSQPDGHHHQKMQQYCPLEIPNSTTCFHSSSIDLSLKL